MNAPDFEEEPLFERFPKKRDRIRFNKNFRTKSCRRKRRFKDLEDAKRFRKSMISRFKKMDRKADPTSIYECPFCNGYHFRGDRPKEEVK